MHLFLHLCISVYVNIHWHGLCTIITNRLYIHSYFQLRSFKYNRCFVVLATFEVFTAEICIQKSITYFNKKRYINFSYQKRLKDRSVKQLRLISLFLFPCSVEKEDEIGSLIKGCNFLLRNIPDEQFSYSRHEEPEYRFINTEPNIFPYLLVNIGSGVSIMKVRYDTFLCMLHLCNFIVYIFFTLKRYLI